MPKHVLQAGGLALFGDQLAARLAGCAQVADQSGDRGALGEHRGVAVEVVELLARAQQGHVFGLAVDVDQQLAKFLEHRQGYAAPIDARATAAAAAGNLAADDQRAVFGLQAVLVQDRGQVG